MDPSASGTAVRPEDPTSTPVPAGQAVAGLSAPWWRGAVIGSTALTLAIGILVLVWLLARPLTLLLIAIVIAQVLTPIVARLERWLPRGIAILLVYLALVVVAGGIGWLVVVRLVGEGQTLIVNAPARLGQAREWLNGIDPSSADRITGAAQTAVDRFGAVLLSLPFTVFSSVVNVLLVVFMSIYWLIATPALNRFMLSLFPTQHRRRVNRVLGAMGQTMGGYLRATAINGVIIAVLTYAGLSIIGLEYVLILAVVAGLGEFLPVVGPIIAAIPAIVIALLDSPQQAIIVAIFYILLQQLESNLLVPVIMRQQADVPPLLSLFAVMAGSTLGGVLGAIIAIPLAGALRVLILQVLLPAEQEWSGADEEPTGRRATAIGAVQLRPAGGLGSIGHGPSIQPDNASPGADPEWP